MKRLWFGVGLLTALLALGVAAAVWMHSACEPVASALEQAAAAAEREQWDEAARWVARGRTRWESGRKLTASLEDHEPMDEISAGFAGLGVYLARQDGAEFTARCAELAERVRDMGEEQQALWWNIL